MIHLKFANLRNNSTIKDFKNLYIFSKVTFLEVSLWDLIKADIGDVLLNKNFILKTKNIIYWTNLLLNSNS